MPSKISFYSHKDRISKKAVKEFEKLVRSKKEIPLKLFQQFRKSQEERIKRWHLSQGSGQEIVWRRSDLIDVLIREIFNIIVDKVAKKKTINGFCIGALGGYGRREMNPYSDIDIVFLHEKKKPSLEIEKVVKEVLMVLWDLGFKVGHATRSISGAIEHANEEMVSKTAMLESRFLAGDKETFGKFQEVFKKKCITGHKREYISWRLKNREYQQEKFGKTIFMQEPNIKSGRGGLRDYQNLLWISVFYNGERNLSYLVNSKIINKNEEKKLKSAHDFLLRVRNEMHYQEKRSCDQLTLLLQGKVATALGYPQRHIIRRSEAFMKDYYEKTRDIYLITNEVLDKMKLTENKSKIFNNILNITKSSERLHGFILKKGLIFPEDQDIFNKDSGKMMKAFHLAQIRSLEFSPHLKDLIKKSLPFIDKTFQYAKENREIFLNILSNKGEVGRILRLMHDLSFLGKYIPEFGLLTCLVQHEFYHRYTADEHTLVCLEKIDELLLTKEKKLSRYSTLFKNLDDPAMLYLGMLLHDTGKAANVRHHAEVSAIAAQKVAKRLQITGARRNLLITLVDAHGELGTIARTRDLDDFTTIKFFSNIVRAIPTLDALMILTLADGMGTGGAEWSDWKEQLVWKLYDKTKKYLEVGPIAFEKIRHDRTFIQEALKKKLPDNFIEEIKAHVEQMPDRYFRMMDISTIGEHIQFFRSFFEGLKKEEGSFFDPQFIWREHAELGYTEVWVCGWDRKNLLKKMAAAFLAVEINILSADIFTRKDNITLDIFRVTSGRKEPLLYEKEKKQVEQKLKELLKERTLEDDEKVSSTLPLSEDKDTEMLARAFIDNQLHPAYTIVDIETTDRKGLFYDLLGALNYAGITIELARIKTEIKGALDTFYILGPDGKKVTDADLVEKLELRLLAATNSGNLKK